MSPPDDAPIPRRLLRAEQVLAARTRRIAIVLESAQDPHNVHAVLRTAEALGIQDVHLVAPRGEASAISPGVTQRAHEWLTVRSHGDVDAAVEHVRAEGREIWVTANAAGAVSLTGLAAERPIAIVFGNEAEGVSARAIQLSDRIVRIDISGFSGSLNLSVAAAIVLWELRRADLVQPVPGDLPAADTRALRARWYSSLLGRPESDAAVTAWLDRAAGVRAEALRADRVVPVDRRRTDGA